MRCPLGGKRGKVLQRQSRAAVINGACTDLPPQYRGNLQVGKLRQDQALAAEPGPGLVAVRTVVRQRYNQDAGVNDEHGRHELRPLPP